MKEYEFHEVANLFPLMEGEELNNLADDIIMNGLKHPIVLHEGKIVDGRNRYLACRMAGIEPKTEEWDGKGSLVAFVVSENLRRRQLTVSQMAGLSLKILAFVEEEAKERQRAGGGDHVSEKYREAVMANSPEALSPAKLTAIWACSRNCITARTAVLCL